jgi:hypothetical protein
MAKKLEATRKSAGTGRVDTWTASSLLADGKPPYTICRVRLQHHVSSDQHGAARCFDLHKRAGKKPEIRNTEMPNTKDVEAGAVFGVQFQSFENVAFDIGRKLH